MAITPMTADAMEKADAIRNTADAAYSRTRTDSRLSPTGIKSRLAAAHLKAKSDMAALQSGVADQATSTLKRANDAAFGVAHLAGTDPVARTQVAISMRDALDRADGITTAQEAATLLQRANDSGDEVLARAVGKHAFEQAAGGLHGSDWTDVVNQYTATRPQAAAAVDTLAALPTRKAPSAADIFGWVVPTPAELQGVSDTELQTLAGA